MWQQIHACEADVLHLLSSTGFLNLYWSVLPALPATDRLSRSRNATTALHFSWQLSVSVSRVQQQQRAGSMVLAGHPTREVPSQTVHAIFQQVSDTCQWSDFCCLFIPRHQCSVMLPCCQSGVINP